MWCVLYYVSIWVLLLLVCGVTCLPCCVCGRDTTRRSDSDLHTNQTYWMEVRNVVRCIYRDPTIMLNGEKTDAHTH